MTSEHLLSANLTTHECFTVLQNAIFNPVIITAFTVLHLESNVYKGVSRNI